MLKQAGTVEQLLAVFEALQWGDVFENLSVQSGGGLGDPHRFGAELQALDVCVLEVLMRYYLDS